MTDLGWFLIVVMTMILPLKVAIILLGSDRPRKRRDGPLDRIADILEMKCPDAGHGERIGQLPSGSVLRIYSIPGAHAFSRYVPRTTLSIDTPFPKSIAIQRESVVSDVLMGRDFALGIPAFDARYRLRGAMVELFAFLDASTRKRLDEISTAGGELEVDWGELRVLVTGEALAPDRTAQIGRLMDELVTGLGANQRSILERLKENVLHDPESAVRLSSMEILLEQAKHSPETRVAAEHALHDVFAPVRVAAAEALGDATAQSALEALLEGSAASEAVLARALRAWAFAATRTEITKMLELLLPKSRGQLLVAILECGVREGCTPPLASFAGRLLSLEPAYARTAAEHLAMLPNPHTERLLVELLGHDNPSVRVDAARALGTIGGIEAVGPLRASAEGCFWDGPAEKAVHAAIAAIQARIEGGGEGALSLLAPDDHRGAMSLRAGESGQISCSDE